MNVLYILVPVALMLAASGVAAFIWSVRSGQFDDVETPGLRVVFDEESEESVPRAPGSVHEQHPQEVRSPEHGHDSEQDDGDSANARQQDFPPGSHDTGRQ